MAYRVEGWRKGRLGLVGLFSGSFSIYMAWDSIKGFGGKLNIQFTKGGGICSLRARARDSVGTAQPSGPGSCPSTLSHATYMLIGRWVRHPTQPPLPAPISPVSHAVASFLIQSVVLGSVLQLLVTAKVVPNSLSLFTPMMKVIRSSEMSVLTGAICRHIPEDGILQDVNLIAGSVSSRTLYFVSEDICH
jgi:hypothetical protein